MPTSLPVRLNDERLHDIQTRASFEASGSFPILLHNGDAPVHVHLHLDDDLSTVASIPANNHFVDANTTREVGVEVEDGPRPVEGRLKIVTGHGAETDYVTVSIVEPAGGTASADATAADATTAGPAADGDAPTSGASASEANSETGGQNAGADDPNAGEDSANAGRLGAGRELPDLSLDGSGPVVVLGLLAVAVAAGSATLSNSVAVLLGALVVLASVAAAGYFLVRGD